MTTTQNTSPRDAAMAKMKALTARQSTDALCAAVVTLAAMPGTPETNLARTAMLNVLCERHPEAEAAAQAWADSDAEYDVAHYDAVIIAAALTAIGA